MADPELSAHSGKHSDSDQQVPVQSDQRVLAFLHPVLEPQIKALLSFYDKHNEQPFNKVTFKVNSNACVLQVENTKLNITQLPLEVQVYLFEFLNPRDLCVCAMVCRRWNEISSSDVIWRPILRRDMYEWHCVGHRCFQGNPGLDIETLKSEELSHKQIYLQCSPDVWETRRNKGSYTYISSLFRSFLPASYLPRVAMFGPGLETSTSSLVHRLLRDPTGPFRLSGFTPGEWPGIGSGANLSMSLEDGGNEKFVLITLYSSTKSERESNRNRNQTHRFIHAQGHDSYNLTDTMKHLCSKVDGFICVVDSSPDGSVDDAIPELRAMTDPNWSPRPTPLLVLSTVVSPTIARIPCLTVTHRLGLDPEQRPWMVADTDVCTLGGLSKAIQWLLNSTRMTKSKRN